jgi:hypothetical protein
MRLSAIYALLAKSSLICPEHHRAAMALWKYCEESARWIFGTSTGDRNADKILIAFRHAPNGMTKTEISVDVFNRHASSADIDEVLKVLHGLNMAAHRIESNGGAAIQRWFYTEETSEKSEQSSYARPYFTGEILRSACEPEDAGISCKTTACSLHSFEIVHS